MQRRKGLLRMGMGPERPGPGAWRRLPALWAFGVPGDLEQWLDQGLGLVVLDLATLDVGDASLAIDKHRIG